MPRSTGNVLLRTRRLAGRWPTGRFNFLPGSRSPPLPRTRSACWRAPNNHQPLAGSRARKVSLSFHLFANGLRWCRLEATGRRPPVGESSSWAGAAAASCQRGPSLACCNSQVAWRERKLILRVWRVHQFKAFDAAALLPLCGARHGEHSPSVERSPWAAVQRVQCSRSVVVADDVIAPTDEGNWSQDSVAKSNRLALARALERITSGLLATIINAVQ